MDTASQQHNQDSTLSLCSPLACWDHYTTLQGPCSNCISRVAPSSQSHSEGHVMGETAEELEQISLEDMRREVWSPNVLSWLTRSLWVLSLLTSQSCFSTWHCMWPPFWILNSFWIQSYWPAGSCFNHPSLTPGGTEPVVLPSSWLTTFTWSTPPHPMALHSF